MQEAFFSKGSTEEEMQRGKTPSSLLGTHRNDDCLGLSIHCSGEYVHMDSRVLVNTDAYKENYTRTTREREQTKADTILNQ